MSGDCCNVDYDEHFGADSARSDILAYRAKGAEGSTRRLVDALLAQGVEGADVLDIGGGVGVVHLELLKAGAAAAVDVDASSPYLETAQAEAEELGFGDRTTYRHGDFVALSEEVPAADVVTLDKVICCYPYFDALVRRSAERARRLYGVVYPVDRWYLRLVVRILNLGTRISGSAYRAYVHPERQVDGLIRAAGLEPAYRHRGWFWQTLVYRRVTPAPVPVST
jgi:magnesium-protoporphyrin O-methyltransferase